MATWYSALTPTVNVVAVVVTEAARGTSIRAATDLAPFAMSGPLTFVVGVDGILRVADRRSEHVACAGGGEVLSAGALTAERDAITEISSRPTGYRPELESWPALAAVRDAAGIVRPGHFTFKAIFRRCPQCGERNLVKNS